MKRSISIAAFVSLIIPSQYLVCANEYAKVAPESVLEFIPRESKVRKYCESHICEECRIIKDHLLLELKREVLHQLKHGDLTEAQIYELMYALYRLVSADQFKTEIIQEAKRYSKSEDDLRRAIILHSPAYLEAQKNLVNKIAEEEAYGDNSDRKLFLQGYKKLRDCKQCAIDLFRHTHPGSLLCSNEQSCQQLAEEKEALFEKIIKEEKAYSGEAFHNIWELQMPAAPENSRP
jgi:hypothetical protein